MLVYPNIRVVEMLNFYPLEEKKAAFHEARELKKTYGKIMIHVVTIDNKKCTILGVQRYLQKDEKGNLFIRIF